MELYFSNFVYCSIKCLSGEYGSSAVVTTVKNTKWCTHHVTLSIMSHKSKEVIVQFLNGLLGFKWLAINHSFLLFSNVLREFHCWSPCLAGTCRLKPASLTCFSPELKALPRIRNPTNASQYVQENPKYVIHRWCTIAGLPVAPIENKTRDVLASELVGNTRYQFQVISSENVG